MKFQEIQPISPLRPYIDRIFILECEGKLPKDDLKLIVPNARVKLVIPYRNSITAQFNGSTYYSKESKITLIGLSDIPAVVDIGEDRPSGNITIEFSPLGAYRFLNLRLAEIKNGIYAFEELAGAECRRLEEQLEEITTIREKLERLQNFLLAAFLQRSEDNVFDYCVKRLIADKGKTLITDLERATGYTARWLNAKFNDRVGTSAKNLGSIIRFQHFYQSVHANKERYFFERELYDYYYDQAHFIKDIKRFTGYPPKQLLQQSNDYDRFFYKG
jgi:hypothetical protein